jgi:hypothetical protein
MDKHPTTHHNCIPHGIFLAAAVAIAGAGLTTFGASPTEAAVLTTGPSNGPQYGGFVCADVRAGSIADGTPAQAYRCNAAPNQQFYLSGLTIYALGGQKCLDVTGAKTTDNTPVQIFRCNGGKNQQWFYDNGRIVNVGSGTCLDAVDLKDKTQLVIYTCHPENPPYQQWQIK